jgi:hypothetical protein
LVTATESTTPRTLANRFADVVNVKDFGAKGDGVTDDSSSFSAAANAATASSPVSDPATVTFSPRASVYVPAGNYLLSSRVDTHGKEITYYCDHGVRLLPLVTVSGSGMPANAGSGLEYLNGRMVRDGIHFEADHFGTKDTASTLSIKGNPQLQEDEAAFINGFSSPSDLSKVLDRDSCTLYLDNRNPSPTLDVASASYTLTTITPSTPLSFDQLKKIRVGMVIDTKHTTKFSGFITSWNATSITVSGWFQQGNEASGQVPSGTTGAYINNFTKVFGQNTIVWLDNDSTNSGKATRCAGHELDIINNLADLTSAPDTTYAWGNDTTATGPYQTNGSVAYQARGRFKTGFLSAGSALSGSYSTDTSGGDQYVGFKYYGDSYGFAYQNRNANNGVAFQILNGGTQTVQFLPNGDLQCQNTARAWVTFNGYGANGPLTVTNGFNVTGITKLATGSYQIYFYNNIANANYAVAGSFSDLSSGPYSVTTSGKYIGSVVIHLTRAGVGLYDVGTVDIIIMGNNV